ncbi:MAG: hypothetical protein ACK5RS_06680, partial [Acidobacteriota bacterium]
MSFKPTLSTHLAQRLVLTPQLRQRIEMLQMNKLELNDLVTQQLNENPVLEELSPEEISVSADLANVDFSDTPVSALASGEIFAGMADGAGAVGESGDYDFGGEGDRPDFLASEMRGMEAPPAVADGQVEVAETREPEIGERDSFEEIDFGTTFEEYLDPGYRTRETEVRESPSFDQFLSAEGSLADHLNWQLRMTMTRPEVHSAAEAIIGNLNDDGFLEAGLEEIATIGPWSLSVVEEGLRIVQQLDPTGVGARDLQESLLIQLDYLGYGQRLACRLVRDCFQKLHHHKLPELAKELGLPVEELVDELKVIRRLDPHPGRKFSPRSAQYIEPEVYIEKIDEDFIIRFND